MEWEASAVAALIGAGIGGLSGVLGQIVTERLRQRGQLRHENRLMLQQAYLQIIEHISRLARAATAIDHEVEKRTPGLPDEVDSQLTPTLDELERVSITVQAVGSRRVDRGLTQVVGWMSQAIKEWKDGASSSREAAVRVREWGYWTTEAIREDLGVEGAEGPGPEPPECELPLRNPVPR